MYSVLLCLKHSSSLYCMFCLDVMLLIAFVSSRLTVKTGNWERGCTEMSSKQKLRENMSSLFPTLEHLMLKCIR